MKLLGDGLIVAIFGALVAQAASISCGDTIDSSTALDGGLMCDCTAGPALTVDGDNIKFDLNGFIVDCDDNQYREYDDDLSENREHIAILVLGKRNRIFNGGVTMANLGVVLAGEGSHTLSDVKVTDTGNDAILIVSDGNTVDGCTVEDAGNGVDGENNGDGIDVSPGFKDNRITNNLVIRAGDDGIDIDGDNTLIMGNIVEGTIWEDHMTIRGTGNRVMNNEVSGVQEDGDGIDVKCNEDDEGNDNCEVAGGGGHTINGNKIHGVGGRGLKIGVSDCRIQGNEIYDNGDDGVRFRRDDAGLFPSNNDFINNNVINNDSEGIQIEDCIDCRFNANLVKGNSKEGIELKNGLNCVFNANVIIENEDEGFKIDGAAKGTTLNGNTIVDNGGGNLLDNAEDTTLKGNKIG